VVRDSRESIVCAGVETAFVRVASRFVRIASCTTGASRSTRARSETIAHRLLERLRPRHPDACRAASIAPRATHRQHATEIEGRLRVDRATVSYWRRMFTRAPACGHRCGTGPAASERGPRPGGRSL
jgi:hypothetical protein